MFFKISICFIKTGFIILHFIVSANFDRGILESSLYYQYESYIPTIAFYPKP